MITGVIAGTSAERCVTAHPEIVHENTTKIKYLINSIAVFPLPLKTIFLFNEKLTRQEHALAIYVAIIIGAPAARATANIM